MSTLDEIQEAVTRLRDDERKALALWLNSQAAPDLSGQEEQLLLRSLDEAIRYLDAGKGVSMDGARKWSPQGLPNNALLAGSA